MKKSLTIGKWYFSVADSLPPRGKVLWFRHGRARNMIWGVREPDPHFESVWHFTTPFSIPRLGYLKFIAYYSEQGHSDLHESFADFLLGHRELYSDEQFAAAVEHSPALRRRVHGSQ